MSRWSATGRPYRRQRAAFLLVHTVCWWCGHGGADEVDHIIAASRAPHLRMVVANWRPIHGHRRCPRCQRACNQERGNRGGQPRSRRSRRW